MIHHCFGRLFTLTRRRGVLKKLVLIDTNLLVHPQSATASASQDTRHTVISLCTSCSPTVHGVCTETGPVTWFFLLHIMSYLGMNPVALLIPGIVVPLIQCCLPSAIHIKGHRSPGWHSLVYYEEKLARARADTHTQDAWEESRRNVLSISSLVHLQSAF